MALLPSQTCLLCSISIYPIVTLILSQNLSRNQPRYQRYAKVNKLLSTCHSSLITALTLVALQQRGWRDPSMMLDGLASDRPIPGSSSLRGSGGGESDRQKDDSRNPLIAHRSEFANSITAIETGYLIQDTLALLLQHYHLGDPKLEKVLLLHHVGIGSALALLQYYVARGRETGIYVIVMFLFMNSSTPLLNVRWYLRKFRPNMKRAIVGVDCAFAAAFFASRVYLIYAILSYYGRYHGETAWEAYWGLRKPCKAGTGALWVAMTAWWCELVRSIIMRTTKAA